MSKYSFNHERQSCCCDHTEELTWLDYFQQEAVTQLLLWRCVDVCSRDQFIRQSDNVDFVRGPNLRTLLDKRIFTHRLVYLSDSQGTSSAIWGFTTERSRFPAPSVTRVSPRNRNSAGTCFPTPGEVSSAATVESLWGTPTASGPTRDCTLETGPIAAPSAEKVRTWYWNTLGRSPLISCR